MLAAVTASGSLRRPHHVAEQPASGAAASTPPPPSSEAVPPPGRVPESDPPYVNPIAEPPILPESPKGSLLWRVRGMIRSVRPHQWVKNLFVLAPVVFAKHLTHPSIIKSALGAFAIFCLLAGAVYTLNDLVDVKADRVHPVKRYRPIASGRVPLPLAKGMAVALVLVALGGALIGPFEFFLTALAYFILNLAYSLRLKKVAYLDVGCIALGFVLRVLAGGFATKTPISGFMVACTALLALFLGFGKRRHELAGVNAAKQRSALEAYSPQALTVALALTGVATVGTYLAYTLDPTTRSFFQSEYLWMTTIHPLFGVFRFLQLVAGRPKAESPTQEMLRDVPFVLNLVMYVAEVIFIVYRLRPS
ncbi:Hypothetical protein CAP_1669 [Chondromyces apiculatus DSM 436]|uniref:Decaprenyl-phosphate phosphoribosyltransferase n=1 Tax=Chondromyces apiculatus DSM 436 TaxID=1192034 RepID=A0A017TBF5_9BACT|nr:Hypothetical protein CAP_1669 [Chondromyces apiculatus DSM 436]